MPTIDIQIVGFADDTQPGIVECAFRDAFSREWVLVDKVPIFTYAHLDANSTYPQDGFVRCEIIREWRDENGRLRCIITTERPDGVQSKNGETQFEMYRDQVKPNEVL